MKYKTQMEAAKHGFVTEEMKIVAKKEKQLFLETETTNQYLQKVLVQDLRLRLT